MIVSHVSVSERSGVRNQARQNDFWVVVSWLDGEVLKPIFLQNRLIWRFVSVLMREHDINIS